MDFNTFYASYGWVIYVGGVIALLVLYFIVRAIVHRLQRVSYSGKHVIITGGSEGMGLAVAEEMFGVGANVTIMARKQEKLEKAIESIEKHRLNEEQQIAFQVLDVTDFEAVQKVIEKIEAKLTIDVLINVVGRAAAGMFSDIPMQDFDDMMALNYRGQVNMARAVLPFFKERKAGQIVFTTSTLALCVIPGYTTYAASKFAVTGMAAALSYEVHAYNIDVSICYPPTMDTPGLKIENEAKPALTWEIESTVEMCNPTDIAKMLIPQMAQKRYHICFDLFTYLCRVVDTPLLTPRSNTLLEFIMIPWLVIMNVFMIPVVQMQVRGFFRKQEQKKLEEEQEEDSRK